MLWTLFVVFFILWILGLAHVYSIGAWIWFFFAIGVVSLVIQFSRRTPTAPPHS